MAGKACEQSQLFMWKNQEGYGPECYSEKALRYEKDSNYRIESGMSRWLNE